MKKKSKGGVYRIASYCGIIGGVNVIHSGVLVKISPNEGKKGGFFYA